MVLDERLVLLNLEAENADEALRKLADRFVETGKAKDSFSDAVIEREKVYPTGLTCEPVNAAVPHCSNEHALQDALGVAVLKHPVQMSLMGSPEKHIEVQLLLMPSVVDPAEQVPTLVHVMGLLNNPEMVSALMGATSEDEVIDLIQVEFA